MEGEKGGGKREGERGEEKGRGERKRRERQRKPGGRKRREGREGRGEEGEERRKMDLVNSSSKHTAYYEKAMIHNFRVKLLLRRFH